MLPCRLSQTAQDFRGNRGQICTFIVYISYGVMASVDDRNSELAGDRSGETFWCEMCTSWDPPKTYVNLASPGVVILDTTIVPDVVGLHAFDDQATLVRVFPDDFPNIVRVLVPDHSAESRGFHDLLLEDLSRLRWT